MKNHAVKILLFLLTVVIQAGWAQTTSAKDSAHRPVNVAADALPGFFHIGIPYAPAPRLSLAGTGRYGLIESIGPVSGSHHELGGTIGVGGVILPWLATSIVFDGKYQKHPADDEGSDYSIIGTPTFVLRAGGPLGKSLLLGAEIDFWFPGADAPSLKMKATTITGKVLGTVISLKPLQIGFSAGFRLDNSANEAPSPATLRAGDRIALDVSQYNAILAGLAFAYQLRKTCLVLELDAQFYAAHKPSFTDSPTRITVGIQQSISPALQFDVSSEILISGRPDVKVESPLLPLPPRFALLVGLRYTFGASTPAELPKEEPITDVAPNPEPIPEKAAPKGSVAGDILDEEGLPVADAEIRVSTSNGTIKSGRTNENGHYTVADVPTGPATVTVSAEYFEPYTFEVTVEANQVQIAAPSTLVQTKVGSQIRGLVRDLEGTPVSAHVLVSPGKHKAQTASDGLFELDVTPGDYSVEISATGFIKQKINVTVGDNSVVIINVDLNPKR